MDEKKVKEKLRRYMYELKEEAETEGYTDTWKEWVIGAIDFCRISGLIGRDTSKELMKEYIKEIRGDAE